MDPEILRHGNRDIDAQTYVINYRLNGSLKALNCSKRLVEYVY